MLYVSYSPLTTQATIMTPTKEELQEAINLLIYSEEYTTLKRDIMTLARMRYGVFSGQVAPLTALVNLARYQGFHALDKAWEIIERKRYEVESQDADFRDRMYQRQYMAERRKRLSAALEAYELCAGGRIPTEHRRLFKETILKVWTDRKEQRWGAKNGGSREQSQRFWADIDNIIASAARGEKSACEALKADLEEGLAYTTGEQLLEAMWRTESHQD